MIVEYLDVRPLSLGAALRLKLVFAVARALRVPISVRDEFYDPALAEQHTGSGS